MQNSILIAPKQVEKLGEGDVLVVPSIASHSVWPPDVLRYCKANDVKMRSLPLNGEKGSFYAIKVRNSPRKTDVNESIEEAVANFLRFAYEHSSQLFILSDLGWRGNSAKGTKGYYFDVDEFLRNVVQVGNIAIPQRMYDLSNLSIRTRCMPTEYKGERDF